MEAHRMQSETFLVQPQRHFTPEATFAFRCVKMAGAMQGVTRVRRCTFACNDQHKACAMVTLGCEEMQQFHAGGFNTFAVQVKTGFRFNLATVQALGGAAVHLGQGWRSVVTGTAFHGNGVDRN